MDDRLLPPSICPGRWPHRPCILRTSPFAPDLRAIAPAKDDCLPMNDAGTFRFESDLFTGVAFMRLTGTQDVGKDYFQGKRRRMQVTTQGQFKEEMNVGDILTGQALNRPLTQMPHSTIVKGGLSILKALSPGARIDLTSDSPYIVSVLAATAQAIDISAPGQEPDVRSEIQENTALFGGIFSNGTDMPEMKRKKYFHNPANAGNIKFKKDLVYTFDFYQDRMDPAQWILDFSIKKFQLARFLNQQPIQVMAMTAERKFLYNFEIWHECLLDPDLAKKCEAEEGLAVLATE